MHESWSGFLSALGGCLSGTNQNLTDYDDRASAKLATVPRWNSDCWHTCIYPFDLCVWLSKRTSNLMVFRWSHSLRMSPVNSISLTPPSGANFIAFIKTMRNHDTTADLCTLTCSVSSSDHVADHLQKVLDKILVCQTRRHCWVGSKVSLWWCCTPPHWDGVNEYIPHTAAPVTLFPQHAFSLMIMAGVVCIAGQRLSFRKQTPPPGHLSAAMMVFQLPELAPLLYVSLHICSRWGWSPQGRNAGSVLYAACDSIMEQPSSHHAATACVLNVAMLSVTVFSASGWLLTKKESGGMQRSRLRFFFFSIDSGQNLRDVSFVASVLERWFFSLTFNISCGVPWCSG